MRPITWGTIWFFIGMIGWVYFSVIAGIETGFSGKEASDSSVIGYVYVFGILFFLSLPAAGIAEIIRWRRKKSKTRMERVS